MDSYNPDMKKTYIQKGLQALKEGRFYDCHEEWEIHR